MKNIVKTAVNGSKTNDFIFLLMRENKVYFTVEFNSNDVTIAECEQVNAMCKAKSFEYEYRRL